jgi:hypothetical protein
MKKIFLILVLAVLVPAAAYAETFTIIVGGNFMSVEDSDYGARYGKQKYFPEGKLSLRVSGNFYLWASFGYFSTSFKWDQWSNKGVSETDVQGKSVDKKSIFAGGLGFYIGYLNPGQFSVKLEAGVCSVSDSIKDTATFKDGGALLNSADSDRSAFGFRGNLGVTYGLFKNIFAEATFGYIFAPTKINETRENLGGLRASFGLGIKF